MICVAKGYSNSKPASPAPVEGGNLSEVEAATAEPLAPAGEPDMTIVTKVTGPEPGGTCCNSEVKMLFTMKVALASLPTCANSCTVLLYQDRWYR